jgi:alpha-beta hydrolase superfamily lysophospholipase
MPLSEIRSVLPALKDPANLHRAVPLTPRQFHYAFTNTLSEEASQAAYDRYAAPPPPGSCSRAASRRSPRTPPPPSTSPTTTGPLLFISGGSDHILPPVVQRHNYEKNAKHSTAIAAHAVFAGRDHFTCGEPGWEAVADFALDWALAPVSGELVP